MDGEYRRNLLECGIVVVERAQQDGNQRCLPIVAMEHVWDAKDLRRFKNRAAEQRESLGVVVVVSQLTSIKRVAFEEGSVFYEIELNSVEFASVDDGC